jgi:arylsulfatase A-like enzyme
VDVPNWAPFCFIENRRTVGIPDRFLPVKMISVHSGASGQGPALKDWSFEPILPLFAERACEWIREYAKDEKPFFLYLSLTSPHTPIAPSKEWQGRSGFGPYGDFILETDDVVGRVMAALDAAGIRDNTMVIFTADNGCSAKPADAEALEARGHFPSGPFRGYKSDVWEGGHRVPFIVSWPGKITPGSVSNQLVQQADIFATVADVLGVKLPDDAAEDSFSLLPILEGKEAPVRAHAVNTSISGVPALRLGHWKYIAGPGSGGWSKGKEDYPVQLYDLENDPGETKNLAAAMPEKVTEMQTLLEKLITDGRSTPGKPQKNDVPVVRFPKNSSSAGQ